MSLGTPNDKTIVRGTPSFRHLRADAQVGQGLQLPGGSANSSRDPQCPESCSDQQGRPFGLNFIAHTVMRGIFPREHTQRESKSTYSRHILSAPEKYAISVNTNVKASVNASWPGLAVWCYVNIMCSCSSLSPEKGPPAHLLLGGRSFRPEHNRVLE